MRKNSDGRIYLTVDGVERVEYKCPNCPDGLYRYSPNHNHAPTYSQLAHVCNKCGALTFLALPYPALRYKGRIFADWETMKGLT